MVKRICQFMAPMLAAAACCVGLAANSLPARATDARAAAVTPPDMQLRVPTQDFSIGFNPSNGHRQLQFAHVTWDAGAGPFEIVPSFSPVTMTASFAQDIYDSPRAGVWRFSHSVQLPVTGVFLAPSHYSFPLTSFTLNSVTAQGKIGKVIATSPKTDFCITGDTYVGGVPNTPNRTFIPVADCENPSKPLGWSVGWGDEYDQTDPGQPIDLSHVRSGTYILQGTVDPDHLLTESNRNNDVVDTKLRISGDSVTVVKQWRPMVIPPRVRLVKPVGGARVRGTITLEAVAAAARPAKVKQVQFLLDGQPLGAPVKSAPFRRSWTVGSAPVGPHLLSARVTDSHGVVSSAPVRAITVVPAGNRLAVDQTVTATGGGALKTARFSTYGSPETLLALVGADGPARSGQQSARVSGASLRWRLVKRENRRGGDAEIWTASATRSLHNVKVTSLLRRPGYDQQLVVLTLQDARGVGASAAGSAASGPPAVSLVTKSKGSLSFAVGNDFDNAIARTVGRGQRLITEWVDFGEGNTFWVQATTKPSGSAGKRVTLNDTAPTTDQWNLAAVEVKPSAAAAAAARPTAGIISPVPDETVTGTVPVVAYADGAQVRSVQFFLDGRPLGHAVAKPPYVARWNTVTPGAGTHRLRARVIGVSGQTSWSKAVTVTSANPAPPMACFVMQTASAEGRGTVTTPAIHTGAPDETLLALVSSSGPARAHGQRVKVSGSGLEWRLVQRANGQYGDAEVWQATAAGVMSAVRVSSRPLVPGYSQEVTLMAMEGTGGVGTSAGRSAAGRPGVNLTTSGPGSLIFAVGSSYRNSVRRTLPPGWAMLSQRRIDHAAFWSQYTNVPVQAGRKLVRVSAAGSADNRWNLVAVELATDGD